MNCCKGKVFCFISFPNQPKGVTVMNDDTKCITGRQIKYWEQTIERLCARDPAYHWNSDIRALMCPLIKQNTITIEDIKKRGEKYWGCSRDNSNRGYQVTVEELIQEFPSARAVSLDSELEVSFDL